MRANPPMHPVTMKMMLPADNPIRFDDSDSEAATVRIYRRLRRSIFVRLCVLHFTQVSSQPINYVNPQDLSKITVINVRHEMKGNVRQTHLFREIRARLAVDR